MQSVSRRARPFSLQDPYDLKFVRDAGFAGWDVFYTVAEVKDQSRDVHSLWVLENGTRSPRRLAADLEDVRVPTASPDGRWLAALASIGGTHQIVLLGIEASTCQQLTSLPQGVAGRPSWSPDGSLLAFAARSQVLRDPHAPFRVDRPTYRFDGLGYLDDVVTDIYVVDVEEGSLQQVTSDRCMNSNPKWSPDGRQLCYRVSFPPERAWTFLPELHVRATDGTDARRVVPDTWGGVLTAEWWPAADRLLFVGRRAAPGFPFTQDLALWVVDPDGGEPVCRTPDVLVGSRIQVDLPIFEDLMSPRICVDGDYAYVSGQAAGDAVIYRVSLPGPYDAHKLDSDGSSYLFDFHPDSGLLHLETSFVEPPELALNSRRLTALNEELLETVARPAVRMLDVTAADGLRTQAWALTPTETDGPWPTVLYIHGGPYGAFGSTYMIDHHLLVGAGFAVLFSNFRGSYGYGADFSAMIERDWGRLGSLDHHAALDEAIRVGIADPDRLGVCGYSHGGFATCWLIATSSRFRAAVAENPLTNWASAYGTADSEWFINGEMGGPPYEVPDAYRERSPLTFANRCRTPLLLIVCEDDLRCRPSESEQYYRVLKTNGVLTEMLRLPGCSHIGSWSGPVAARAAQNEGLIGWFKEHLASSDVGPDRGARA